MPYCTSEWSRDIAVKHTNTAEESLLYCYKDIGVSFRFEWYDYDVSRRGHSLRRPINTVFTCIETFFWVDGIIQGI